MGFWIQKMVKKRLCSQFREEHVREQLLASLWVTSSSDDHGDSHVLETLIASISEGP